MRSLVTIVAVLALSATVEHGGRAEQLSQADFVQYRDEEYRFSIHYPRSWAKVDASLPETRFKAVSDGGKGNDDLSVAVNTLPGSEEVTPEEILKWVDPQAYLEYMQQNVVGAKLIEHGQTSLSNQAAYYFVTDLTYRVLGIDVPMRVIQVKTVRKQNVYTITYRTDPEPLPSSLALFQFITAGFVLWPEPPDAGIVGSSARSPHKEPETVALRAGLFTLILIGLFALGAIILRFALFGRALSKLSALGVVVPVWLALLWFNHQAGGAGAPPWLSAGAVVAFFLLTSPQNTRTLAR